MGVRTVEGFFGGLFFCLLFLKVNAGILASYGRRIRDVSRLSLRRAGVRVGRKRAIAIGVVNKDKGCRVSLSSRGLTITRVRGGRVGVHTLLANYMALAIASRGNRATLLGVVVVSGVLSSSGPEFI